MVDCDLLHRVVARKRDESTKCYGEGIEHLGTCIQPGSWVGQLCQLGQQHNVLSHESDLPDLYMTYLSDVSSGMGLHIF